MDRDAPVLDTVLDNLKIRLEAWAEWYSRGAAYGLGYAWCTLEYRLLRGGRVACSGIPLPLPTNRDAEEIEAWVCEMAAVYPRMASALRYYYFYPGSLRAQAVRLNLSHTHVKRLVQRGHHWLAGRWCHHLKTLSLGE